MILASDGDCQLFHELGFILHSDQVRHSQLPTLYSLRRYAPNGIATPADSGIIPTVISTNHVNGKVSYRPLLSFNNKGCIAISSLGTSHSEIAVFTPVYALSPASERLRICTDRRGSIAAIERSSNKGGDTFSFWRAVGELGAIQKGGALCGDECPITLWSSMPNDFITWDSHSADA